MKNEEKKTKQLRVVAVGQGITDLDIATLCIPIMNAQGYFESHPLFKCRRNHRHSRRRLLRHRRRNNFHSFSVPYLSVNLAY